MDEQELLTASEVGRLVKLSSKSIYRLAARDASFPCSKIGGSRRFPRGEVLRWITQNTQGVTVPRRRAGRTA